MKAKKTLILLRRIIIALIVIWLACAITDFRHVFGRQQRPVFSLPARLEEDGASGLYRGLGYSFLIEGNFKPEDENPGITKAQLSFLGKEIKTYIRD